MPVPEPRPTSTAAPARRLGPALIEISHEQDKGRDIGDADAPPQAIFFRDCTDGEYHITGRTLRIQIEDCDNLVIHVDRHVMSETLEIWRSTEITIKTKKRLHTIQVDDSEDIRVESEDLGHLSMVVWVNSKRISLQAGDAALYSTGSDVFPSPGQYKAMLVEEEKRWEDAHLPRLAGGFPNLQS